MSWLWGQDPKRRFCAPTRNVLAQLKIQCAGALSQLIIPMDAIPNNNEAFTSFDDIQHKLQWLDAGKLKSLGEKGAVFVLQNPHDCLYIPAGHVVLEFASDAPMVYGLRKPLLVRGERDHLNYGRLV